jgi:hypothetical protein
MEETKHRVPNQSGDALASLIGCPWSRYDETCHLYKEKVSRHGTMCNTSSQKNREEDKPCPLVPM